MLGSSRANRLGASGGGERGPSKLMASGRERASVYTRENSTKLIPCQFIYSISLEGTGKVLLPTLQRHKDGLAPIFRGGLLFNPSRLHASAGPSASSDPRPFSARTFARDR